MIGQVNPSLVILSNTDNSAKPHKARVRAKCREFRGVANQWEQLNPGST